MSFAYLSVPADSHHQFSILLSLQPPAVAITLLIDRFVIRRALSVTIYCYATYLFAKRAMQNASSLKLCFALFR